MGLPATATELAVSPHEVLAHRSRRHVKVVENGRLEYRRITDEQSVYNMIRTVGRPSSIYHVYWFKIKSGRTIRRYIVKPWVQNKRKFTETRISENKSQHENVVKHVSLLNHRYCGYPKATGYLCFYILHYLNIYILIYLNHCCTCCITYKCAKKYQFY